MADDNETHSDVLSALQRRDFVSRSLRRAHVALMGLESDSLNRILNKKQLPKSNKLR